MVNGKRLRVARAPGIRSINFPVDFVEDFTTRQVGEVVGDDVPCVTASVECDSHPSSVTASAHLLSICLSYILTNKMCWTLLNF